MRQWPCTPLSQPLTDIKDWNGRDRSSPAASAMSQHVLTGTSSRHRACTYAAAFTRTRFWENTPAIASPSSASTWSHIRSN